MPLPEFTKRLVEVKLLAYCHNKVPKHARKKVKIYFKVSGSNVTIYESKPYHLDPSVWKEMPVARFLFDQESKKWSLYCADKNCKWRSYTDAEPSINFDNLLKEVDRDPTGVFWR